ncbi:MAG: domain containing protein [Conexibacter sp.]|nr:domain containing protein [Conexibacter sp.]
MQSRTLAAMTAVLSVAVAALPAAAGAAPTWLPTQSLGAAPHEPKVAMNGPGDAVVIGDHGLTVSPAGGTVSQRSEGVDAGSSLALSSAGDLLVGSDSMGGTFVRDGSLTAPLGAPFTLTTGVDFATPLGLADDGSAAAAWNEDEGSGAVPHWRVRAADGTWGPAASDPAADSGVLLRMARDGEALLVTTRGGKVLGVSTRPPGAPAFGAFQAISDGADWTYVSDLAIASNGAAIVSWQQGDDLMVARRPAGASAFGAPVKVGSVSSGIPTSVGINRHGESVVVWGEIFDVYAVLGRPDGTFSGPVVIGQRAGADPIGAAIADSGLAVVDWLRYPVQLVAAIRPPSGAFGAPTELQDPGDGVYEISGESLAVDDAGDAVIAWNTQARLGRWRRLDASGPVLKDLSVPSAATTGQPVGVSVGASDLLSAVGTTTWSFGDGATTSGASATHAFGAAGSYDVRVTVADAVGNTTSETRQITVAAAPGAPATPKPPVVAKPKTRCKVPPLKNLTTARAKARLKSAHCKLGKVTTPKRLKHRRGLVIRSQSRKVGTKTTAGAKVNVTLGTKPKAKKKATKK